METGSSGANRCAGFMLRSTRWGFPCTCLSLPYWLKGSWTGKPTFAQTEVFYPGISSF